jgi:hypothetical protein
MEEGTDQRTQKETRYGKNGDEQSIHFSGNGKGMEIQIELEKNNHVAEGKEGDAIQCDKSFGEQLLRMRHSQYSSIKFQRAN